jgi:4-hydroxy-tetrahydrodipicolinate synthase
MIHSMKKLFGVVVPMTTPFDQDGKVDIKALEKQIDFLIEKGVHGLYPCGTTGEMLLMSLEERELVAETVVKRAARRITVFVHCGAMATKDTLRLGTHALSIGADGIGVVTPSFFGIDDEAMFEYYKTISVNLPKDFPIYLYNIPQCSTNDISVKVCKELAQAYPNIVGIKYSGSDASRVLEYLKVNHYNYSVLVGADRLFLQYLVMGCEGTVSGCAGVFPEVFVSLYKAYKAGNIDEAKTLQRKANEIITILKAGTNLSLFKEALKLRGLEASYVRPPLLDISDKEKYELKNQLQAFL